MATERTMLQLLNEVLADVRVSSGYDILYGSPSTCFRFTSAQGYLQAEEIEVAAVQPHLSQCSTRVIFTEEDDVLKAGDVSSVESLFINRRVQIQGDGGQLRALQKELEPHRQRLQAQLESRADALGIDTAEGTLKLWSQEPQSTAALVPGLVAGVLLMTTRRDGMRQPVVAAYQDAYVKKSLANLIMFSAASTMWGSMGQSNYTAANFVMEQVAFQSRIARHSYDITAILWGVIGGLGMRFKAFGSMDFGLAAGEDTYLTLDDSMRCLRGLLGVESPPENVCSFVMDNATRAFWGFPPVKGEGPAAALAPDLVCEATAPTLAKQTASVGRREAEISKQPPQHCIAGSWDGWVAHNMVWNAENECYSFKVQLGQEGVEQFQICKGTAGGKKLKSLGATMWRIPHEGTSKGCSGDEYLVRCFFRSASGSCRKVDWIRQSRPQCAA
mmetsp:Transcript_43938/g.80290  ORF Transcript_43938/g.80290 Transcript_43938/m.80290 type:complete len:444 (+) Transcript_43938:178-1509(+)